MAVCTVYTVQTLNSTCSISKPNKTHLGFHQKQVVFYRTSKKIKKQSTITCSAAKEKTVVIGLAADSGCGKSTFMRRLTNVFGGAAEPPKGGNPDSNTLISDMTTVICLDDYHVRIKLLLRVVMTHLDELCDEFKSFIAHFHHD